MARNAGFAVVFAFCSFLFARHAMRLASSELRHENRDEMRSENSTPQRGQIISGELLLIGISTLIFDCWTINA